MSVWKGRSVKTGTISSSVGKSLMYPFAITFGILFAKLGSRDSRSLLFIENDRKSKCGKRTEESPAEEGVGRRRLHSVPIPFSGIVVFLYLTFFLPSFFYSFAC